MRKFFRPLVYFTGKKFNATLFVLAFVFTVMIIFSGAFAPKSEKINIGDISPKRYVATRSVENTVETQKLIKAAKDSVGNLYKHDPNVAVNAEKQIDDMFSAIDDGIAQMKENAQKEAAWKNAINKVGAEDGDYQSAEPQYDYDLNITLGVPAYFTSSQYQEYDNLSDEDKALFIEDIKYGVNYAFELGITEDTRQSTIKKVENIVNETQWNDTLKAMAYTISDAVIVPNLILDEDAIEAAKEQKASEVEPVMVLKDQKIVDSGEVITAEAYAILTSVWGFTDESTVISFYYRGLGSRRK